MTYRAFIANRLYIDKPRVIVINDVAGASSFEQIIHVELRTNALVYFYFYLLIILPQLIFFP